MTISNRLESVLDRALRFEAPARVSPRLLNLAVDSLEKLFRDINDAFADEWLSQKGETVKFRQSYGTSREIIDAVKNGFEGDTVTFANESDINELRDWLRLVPSNWKEQFPYNGSPFLSTIVFLVRKNNRYAVRNWDDLTRSGLSILTADFEESWEGQMNYLAAWGFAAKKFNSNEAATRQFVAAVLRNVTVSDLDSAEALGLFVRSGFGDVLIARENDALRFLDEWGDDEFEIVTPSESIAVEFSTALINDHAPAHPQALVSQAYLAFLYSETAQKLAVKHYLRPRSELEFVGTWPFQHANLSTVSELFGGWDKAQKIHFSPDGTLQQIRKALRFFA